MKSVKADQPRKCYKCSPETCAMSGLELSRNASSILKTKSNAYCYARSSTTRVPHKLKQLGLQAAVPWWWPHVSFNVVQSSGATWSQRRGRWQAHARSSRRRTNRPFHSLSPTSDPADVHMYFAS